MSRENFPQNSKETKSFDCNHKTVWLVGSLRRCFHSKIHGLLILVEQAKAQLIENAAWLNRVECQVGVAWMQGKWDTV